MDTKEESYESSAWPSPEEKSAAWKAYEEEKARAYGFKKDRTGSRTTPIDLKKRKRKRRRMQKASRQKNRY